MTCVIVGERLKKSSPKSLPKRKKKVIVRITLSIPIVGILK